MTDHPSPARAGRACFVQTLAVLVLGLAAVPEGWARARSALESLHSTELNRADRDASAGGYYEGLIGVTDGLGAGRGALTHRIASRSADRR